MLTPTVTEVQRCGYCGSPAITEDNCDSCEIRKPLVARSWHDDQAIARRDYEKRLKLSAE